MMSRKYYLKISSKSNGIVFEISYNYWKALWPSKARQLQTTGILKDLLSCNHEPYVNKSVKELLYGPEIDDGVNNCVISISIRESSVKLWMSFSRNYVFKVHCNSKTTQMNEIYTANWKHKKLVPDRRFFFLLEPIFFTNKKLVLFFLKIRE